MPQLTPEICEREFAPKLYGVLHLEQAIGQLTCKPKFVVLFSSMAAILGGLAMGAYAAANCFMDAFAQANPRRHGVSWLSINWDDWDFAYDREQIVAYEKTQVQFAMSPAEGIEALDRILAYGQPIQLLVATRALQPRIAQWLQQQTRSVSPAARIAERPADGNRLEQPVAAIYREVLGLTDIASDDNFFDLGGDSLLASQVLLQLRRQLPQAQLQLPMIFDYPTVREMARYLAENHAG